MSNSCRIDLFQLKSRVVRAVYYEPIGRKLIVQTMHGKHWIYGDVDAQLFYRLATSEAPGVLFNNQLKSALRPNRERMTLSNYLLLRRARKLLKSPYNADQTITLMAAHIRAESSNAIM